VINSGILMSSQFVFYKNGQYRQSWVFTKPLTKTNESMPKYLLRATIS